MNAPFRTPTVIEAMESELLFAPHFRGETWSTWKTILRAAYALALTPKELAIFDEISGGRAPPAQRVRQLWVLGGRRGGKDSVASLVGAYAAAVERTHIGHLRVGERAMILCIASDRSQADIVLGYIRGYFDSNPALSAMVTRWSMEGLELDNGCDIVVATNDFRNIRGRSILLAIMDEVGFWRSERSLNPDVELYNAVVPSLSLPGSLLIGISTPHLQGGLLYERFRKYYGVSSDQVLFIRATSLQLRPSPEMAALRDEAFEDDPIVALSEYDVAWRRQSDAFISAEKLEALIDVGVTHREPLAGVTYIGAIDASLLGGGVNPDSFTGAVAHNEGRRLG